MTSQDLHARASEIFLSLRSLPPDQRSHHLSLAADGNLALLAEVRSLLDHDVPDDPSSAETSPVSPASFSSAHALHLPKSIGPYKIISRLGAGASGVVFLAQQLEPVNRRVALKIVPHAAMNPELAARFEVEQRALERTDHPNIARILDAGRTPDGLPFLVMDFVDGLPLTDFCTQHVPSPIDRISLFLLVADAVLHAHQRGVIHRDLKPANVLVAQQPGRPPAPRVLDFGIAKPVAGALDASAPASIGLPLGTPAYMAPEQTGGQPVDTRADIYSLGVILYQLLSGSLPIPVVQDILESIRRIRQAAPVPLAAAIAANTDHALSPPLPRSMLTDLQCILDVALRKSPAHRYQTVAAFIDDLQRLLRRQPISARPPTLAYRAARFTQRNRALVAAVLLVSAALLAGIAGLAIGLIQADTQRRHAAQQLDEKSRINQFLTDDLLAAAEHDQAGSSVTALQLLDRAARRVDARFATQPLIAASIHHTLGVAYTQLGEFDKAQPHLDAAVSLRRAHAGLNSVDTLHSEIALASLLGQRELYQPAHDILVPLLDRARVVLDKTDPAFISLLTDLAVVRLSLDQSASALSLLQEALDLQTSALNTRQPQTVAIMRYLAMAHDALGDSHQALQVNLQALDLASRLEEPPRLQIFGLNNDIGATYQALDRNADAAPYLRTAYQQSIDLFGPAHPYTATVRGNLASLESEVGDPLRAADLYLAVIQDHIAALGPDAPSTFIARLGYANALWRARKLAESYDALLPLLADIRRALGPFHWLLAAANSSIARVLFDSNRPADARPYALAAVDLFSSLPDFGPDHVRTTTAQKLLSDITAAINSPSSPASPPASAPHATPSSP